MTLIILLVCKAAACHAEQLVKEVSPLACAGLGPELQEVAAQWANENPGWRVARYRCGRFDERRA